MIKHEHKHIVVTNTSFFLMLFIVTLFMFCSVLPLFFEQLPLEDKYDIQGFVFTGIWLFLVGRCCFSFFSICIQKTIIHDNGVTCKLFKHSTDLLWSEIKDYGISYEGKMRGNGSLYIIYFSKRELNAKNKYQKNLKRPVTKAYLTDSEYSQIVNIIIPYCQMRTTVTPFISPLIDE